MSEALGRWVTFTISTSRLRGMLDLKEILIFHVVEFGRLVGCAFSHAEPEGNAHKVAVQLTAQMNSNLTGGPCVVPYEHEKRSSGQRCRRR